MVQPNNRVFPVAWISREQYDRFKGQFMKLGDKTKTDITFNFEEQYFDIKGRTAQGTEQVAELIVKELTPVLYQAIDEESLRGTFPNLDQASALLKEGVDSSYTHEGPGSVSADSDESEVSDGSDYYSDDSLDYMRGPKKVGKGKGKQGKEEKSAVMKKKKNEFHEVFTFAKNVKDPEDILFGPPYDTMSSADYVYIVMQETDTECTPDNRTIQIFGPDAASVKSAAEKFRFLQSSYKRIRRHPTPVPCLHLSVDSEEYGLYFCDLDSYADQSYVALPQGFKRPAYVLIPSFKDKKTDKYMRPQGLLDSSQVLSSASAPRQQRSAPTYEELDERFSRASESPYMSPSTSWQSGQFTERTNAPPGQALLWGEQQYTVKHSPPPAPNRGRGRGRGSRQQPPDKPRWGTPPMSAGTAEDFPALGGGSQAAGRGRGSSQRGGGRGGNNNNQRGRRVMRLTSQKSSRGSPSPPKSMLMMAREYNMHNMKEALSEGLEAARQFRGEVTLTAKLGKVLWRNLPTSTEKTKVWGFMDIKDICMKEHKVKPEFNNVTITREDLLHTTLDSIGNNCGHAFYRSAFFEVHVEGRAKMNEHFKPGVLYIDASGAKCFKVHLHQHVLAEIDWVSLDKKFDFQMNLTVKEMGRAEVSPFKPFMRRVVLRPSDQRRDTNDLSFQEISNGNLLRVVKILHKQVQKFRLSETVAIQVTRTEIVPRELDTPGRDPKYSAKPGKGPFSYDIEVLYAPYEKLFKENLSKPIFQDTKWTVDDVFGHNNRLFSPYIANILSTINHLDTQLSS
ncbi:hypothetical protein BJV82DRAFT_600905 [Fennellomyces sp. T-0311]|nr:hypothetical protein BJV82DRAFT_600905 [Fennellomyces sp. T-0311]